ncbi:MAG: PAS domain-containing protein [Aquihabitans sp.]
MAPIAAEASPFDEILAVLETQDLLGGEPCDVVALECAAGIRADKLSIETMDEYLAFTGANPTELKELAGAVAEARARLEAESLVPEGEVDTVVEELEATIDALEQSNQDRRSTVDDLRNFDHELTLAASELEVVTSQLDERTREVERLNDFVQGILATVHRPMIVVDLDLMVRAWNEPAASMLETSVKDAVGRPVSRLATWLKVGPIADALTGTLAGDRGMASGELAIPGHAGSRVVITVIADVDDEVVGAVLQVDPPAPS